MVSVVLFFFLCLATGQRQVVRQQKEEGYVLDAESNWMKDARRNEWRRWLSSYRFKGQVEAYENATEAERRFEIFAHNLRFIIAHNTQQEKTFQCTKETLICQLIIITHVTPVALNKFADRTLEEMRSRLLVAEGHNQQQIVNNNAESLCGSQFPPPNYSWTDVTVPRDQGINREKERREVRLKKRGRESFIAVFIASDFTS